MQDVITKKFFPDTENGKFETDIKKTNFYILAGICGYALPLNFASIIILAFALDFVRTSKRILIYKRPIRDQHFHEFH